MSSNRVIGGIRLGLSRLVELDLPLAVASGLLVMGTMLNVFSLLSAYTMSNKWLTWLTVLSGSFSWLFAIGIFCIFPPGASPRHSKAR